MDDLITAKQPNEKREPCEDCDGTGYRDGDVYAEDREACWSCGGWGERRKK